MSSNDPIWQRIRDEATQSRAREPHLASFLDSAVLEHADLDAALGFNLARQLCCPSIPAVEVEQIIAMALRADANIGRSVRLDMQAVLDRDAACDNYLSPLLFFKGFQALQLYRIGHWLWTHNRPELALYFQNQISENFAVDIHPAAQIGAGIMLDHATGLVIGETAVIGDNVSILHAVTLGGSGAQAGDRHPKIGNGVMIAAGAKILGNILIGAGVKVGAGSLVLESVPDHVTVVGVPAKIVGAPTERDPALEMNQAIDQEG
ncbi:MAG: serine O-acetyltransferase [Porticoccaceae bacterium]